MKLADSAFGNLGQASTRAFHFYQTPVSSVKMSRVEALEPSVSITDLVVRKNFFSKKWYKLSKRLKIAVIQNLI